MLDDNQLVPVKNQNELKPGMAVVLKSCMVCSKTHTMIILRCVRSGLHYHDGESRGNHPCFSATIFFGANEIHTANTKFGWCFRIAIEEERLFRFELSDDESESAREKAVDRVST